MEKLISHNGKLLVSNGKAFRYGKVLNETVVLHISSSGTLPRPIIILVKKVEDESVLHTLSWNGSDLTFLVRDGVQYRIEYGSAGVGFVSPSSYTATAIGDTQRDVDAQYDIANGVYIGYTDGAMSPYDEFVLGKIAEGVVIKTDSVCMLLHPREGFGEWSTNTTTLIPGVTTAATQALALIDFAGKSNTAAAVVSGLAGTAFTFATALGSDWYLPACGEMEQIRLNATNVNIALGLIGGTKLTFDRNPYWCSTQGSSSNAQHWSQNAIEWGNVAKTKEYYCRAVRDW